MDVGEDWDAFGLHAGQDAQALAQAWPAIRPDAGAIGLVEGGLEDEVAHHLADGSRHAQDVLLAFDDAGAGDEHQRPSASEGARTQSARVYDASVGRSSPVAARRRWRYW